MLDRASGMYTLQQPAQAFIPPFQPSPTQRALLRNDVPFLVQLIHRILKRIAIIFLVQVGIAGSAPVAEGHGTERLHIVALFRPSSRARPRPCPRTGPGPCPRALLCNHNETKRILRRTGGYRAACMTSPHAALLLKLTGHCPEADSCSLRHSPAEYTGSPAQRSVGMKLHPSTS